MLEQLSDRARMTMALANQEAMRLNHDIISPEHILLGLLKVDGSDAMALLTSFNIDPHTVRLNLEMRVKSGPEMVTIGKLPQTSAAKKVIEQAILETRRLQHSFVGTMHLLLGLMCVGDSIAARVLSELGLTLEHLRVEAGGCESKEKGGVHHGPIPSAGTAESPGGPSRSTGHVLLAIIVEDRNVAARALTDLGISLEDVRESVKRLINAGESDSN